MSLEVPVNKLRLWAELIALFVGGPIVLTLFPGILGDGRLFLFLWLCAGACLVVLFRDRSFDRWRLWLGGGDSVPPSLEGGAGGGWRAADDNENALTDQAPKAGSGDFTPVDCVGKATASINTQDTRHPPPAPPSREGGKSFPRTAYLFDHLGWIALRWVLLGTIIVFAYGLFAGKVVFGLRVPVEVFGLPRRMPGLFFTIALFYPWVSVYPQNVIYRAFFCHRYAPILGSGWGMILISAALFSFGHYMFGNWIVLMLTFAGGILFTRTYLRSRSLLLSVIEHALYGLLCFSIGIGIYLLYGASS